MVLIRSYRLIAVLLCTLFGCHSNVTPQEPDVAGLADAAIAPKGPQEIELVPGLSAGPVQLGMTYEELVAAVGEPDGRFAFQRVVTLKYKTYALEVVLASSDANEPTPDARVISMTTLPGAKVRGDIAPGMTREEAIARMGEPTAQDRGVAYFPSSGISIKFDSADFAVQIATW